ncbi:hypothetical protein ACHAXR_012742 [Thalassiosira sp. AJA248-18]
MNESNATIERWILLRKFLHWRSISQTRGKALRLLRKPTSAWRQWARRKKILREREKKSRLAIRACRINNALELCLTHLAISRIANAAEVGRWLQTRQPAHVPIANRLDHLLDEYELGHEQEIGPETEKQENTHSCTKQLYIQGKVLTLSEHDLAGFMALKQFHWLLTKFGDNERNTVDTFINSQSIHAAAASPMDRLQHQLKKSGVDIGIDFDIPSALPNVHVLDLIMLADEIQSTLEKFNKANRDLNRDMLQQHYISTGLANTSQFASEPRTHQNFQKKLDGSVPGNQFSIGDMSVDIDLDIGTDNFFDIEEEQSFAKYLTEISTAGKESHYDADQASLVDAVATSAQTNLSVMKLDVDKSLFDARSSEINLVNYKEFIEKKNKQRIQCLRDIETHCCKCQGPHVSKPPFNHGKDYRREPTHIQHQGSKCLFLKKKRAELKWLDETLGNYSKNNKRFEREIEKRKAETQSRKENMKEALANSLRLMELASE